MFIVLGGLHFRAPDTCSETGNLSLSAIAQHHIPINSMVLLDHFAFVATQAAASFMAPEASRGAPPRTMQVPRRHSKDAHHTEEDDTTEDVGPIPFCFFVHGHKDRPADLSYLHRTLRATA